MKPNEKGIAKLMRGKGKGKQVRNGNLTWDNQRVEEEEMSKKGKGRKHK